VVNLSGLGWRRDILYEEVTSLYADVEPLVPKSLTLVILTQRSEIIKL